MIISNHIEKSEDGLEQLIDAAMRFEENHYLDAVRQKKLKEYDILSLTEDVVIWHGRMRKESLRLAAFSDTPFKKAYSKQTIEGGTTTCRLSFF